MFLGKASTPWGLRVYAIGDIHGCGDLLADVHARIAVDLAQRPVAEHRVVHIGDYVDRGPDSAGAIARLVRYAADHPEAVFLRGNHDALLLGFLADPSTGDTYLSDNIGGRQTLRSYDVRDSRFGLVARSFPVLAQELAERMPPEHLAFLRGLSSTARFGGFLFVHAGIRPGIPLEKQDPEDLVWIRDEFLNDGRDHGFVVVHGHTIAKTPELMPNRINIDTGAVFGGPLTCLVLEGTEHRFL